MKQFFIRIWDYIVFLWEKMFVKNHCQICDTIIKYDSEAMCLVGNDGTLAYICEPCVENAWRQSVNNDLFEDITLAEQD